MPHPRRLGTEAEDAAARFLADQGFTIVTRRFKARAGEIDVVALDRETLVFVEVRYRSRKGDLPEGTLSERKRARLLAAARAYLAIYAGPERAVRYDLVAIDPLGIRLHKAAFSPGDLSQD
jgi:putative endonuclease